MNEENKENTNKKFETYDQRLERLIKEGENLLSNNLSSDQHMKLEHEVNELRLKMFKWKVNQL